MARGLHDVRTDLKSREVLLPITRFGTRHARFLHPSSEQARNVRRSFRRYRSSWLKKYTWASRGIELYPQNGGQAAVVDAWGFTAYGGFDGARCPFSTFLRLQGDHHCASAQKWCHFSYFSKSFQTIKKWHFSAVDYRNIGISSEVEFSGCPGTRQCPGTRRRESAGWACALPLLFLRFQPSFVLVLPAWQDCCAVCWTEGEGCGVQQTVTGWKGRQRN